MLLDKIKLLYFLISFSIGLFFCYITQPPAEIVMKFPSPNNAGKVTYKDKDGQCYVYHADKISCASHEHGVVKAQPVMEDFKNKNKNKATR